MPQDRLILTMMQHAHRRGPSAHGLAPWGGSGRRARSSSRHISAMFEYGFPPPRIVNSAVVLKTQRERRMMLSAMLVPVSPSGRWT